MPGRVPLKQCTRSIHTHTELYIQSWGNSTYTEVGEEGMLEDDLEPSLAGERLRAAGMWFGERLECVFWASGRGPSLAIFEVVGGENFVWEVTWRSSEAAEDVEGGLLVGFGVADCRSVATAAAAGVEWWKDAGVGVVGVSATVALMLDSDDEDKRIG